MHKYLFVGLLLVFIFTFFSRNNVRSVNEVVSAIIEEPLQSRIYNHDTIEFVKNGYAYSLTPLFDYEINGLLVSKVNYNLFSTDKFERLFPFDVCLIWGSNVARGLYRDTRVRFSQDCRWCWADWYGNVNFNLNELSNNHLLVDNNKVLKLLKLMVRGDQIKIKGKLVNIQAKLANNPGPYDITWNSSLSRQDTGAGACELIYVEQAEILKKANVISRTLFRFSSYGLLFLIAWKIINFIRELIMD